MGAEQIMKINPQQIQNVVGTYRKASGKADAGSGVPQVPKDEVELSDRSGEVARARQTYDQLPEVRAARVAALREQIQNGTYRLEDSDIAEALLTGKSRTSPEAED